MSKQKGGPTPGPYQVVRCSGTGTFEMWADHRSRAVERWARKHPKLKSHFNCVTICRMGVMFNGGGRDYGPDRLISLDEVAANVALLRAAPEMLEALEAEEEAARLAGTRKGAESRKRANELRKKALARTKEIDPSWLVQRKGYI